MYIYIYRGNCSAVRCSHSHSTQHWGGAKSLALHRNLAVLIRNNLDV